VTVAQVTAGKEAIFTLGVFFESRSFASKDLLSVGYTLFGADGSMVDQGSGQLAAEGQ
jgi:hypothetical protein